MKRLAAGICALAIAALAQMPLPAHADTYRYWSYWVGGEAWSYSARGPGFRVPPDGGVEGWRFVVSPKDGSQAGPPGTAGTYDQLCPGQASAPAGQKRVAVVIDPGPAGIAPVGEIPPARSVSCLSVPADANGLQVLQQVGRLRFHSSGLICGINGFPASECPGQTTAGRTASPAPSAADPQTVPTVPAPADVATAQPRSAGGSQRPSPTPTPSDRPTGASQAPSPVALTLPQEQPPPAGESAPPAWIAAIGVAMIAALLGLAILVRRGRG